MARRSVKENKNIYQLAREAQGLTREAASEELEWISESKLEKIENETTVPQPEDVIRMSQVYKCPELPNYYCTEVCAIGQKYMHKVTSKNLQAITLEMLMSLEKLNKTKDKLMQITVDGMIDDQELTDFLDIRNHLNEMSATISSLQLWVDNEILQGHLPADKFE